MKTHSAVAAVVGLLLGCSLSAQPIAMTRPSGEMPAHETANCSPLLGTGALQAQEAAHLLKGKPEPYLEISLPEGRIVVKLFGQDDGPVRIPVKDQRISALLLMYEMTEKGVEVSLGTEEGQLKVLPLGHYTVAMGEEMPLLDLEALGLQGWRLKASVGILASTITDCCSCGRINCCPLPGKCLGCSSCGACCGSGLPEV